MARVSANPRNRDERLRRIEAVTDTALARLTLDDLLVALLKRVGDLLEADTASVLLLDEPAGQLVVTASQGLEAGATQGFRLPVGEGFSGRIAAEQQPVILTEDQIDAATVRNPALREKGLQSLLEVPLIASGSLVGVMHVGSLRPRQFSQDDAELLQRVADRVALAVTARRSEMERNAVVTLQHAFLPAQLPSLPAFEFAARYIPGAELDVGGDWYDVFTLPDGQLGVVIGDVVGRGLRAAVIMSRLRDVLRAYALEYDDPATVLAHLDQMTQRFEPEVLATVLYAIVDPERHAARISVAGHPPPMYAPPDRSAQLLPLRPDPPLGAFPEVVRHTEPMSLPVGSLLFLYTDGLVERRHRSLTAGLALLSAAIDPSSAEEACSSALRKVVGDESVEDDIAVLALRHRPVEVPPAPTNPRPAAAV